MLTAAARRARQTARECLRGASVLSREASTALEDSLAQRLAQSAGNARVSSPALDHLWRRECAKWSHATALFVQHAVSFARARALPNKPPTVVEVLPDLSEPHGGGRTVLRVILSDSTRWYYKPRDGRSDAAWTHLVEAINRSGFSPSLRATEIHIGHRHCWSREVRRRRWRTPEEEARFFRRTGALLGLAHRLRAVDLHRENIVVSGEFPVLVDAETFFHPRVKMPPAFLRDRESMFATGIISRRGFHSRRGDANFIGSLRTRRWPDRAAAERLADEVAAGFVAIEEFLKTRRRNDEVARAMTAFGRIRPRCIHRPSACYWSLLNAWRGMSVTTASGSPDLEFLKRYLDDGLCTRAVLASEVRQLAAGDIPWFRAAPARPRRAQTPRQRVRFLADVRRALLAGFDPG